MQHVRKNTLHQPRKNTSVSDRFSPSPMRLMAQLASAFERCGFTTQDVNDMTKGHNLEPVRLLLSGEGHVVVPRINMQISNLKMDMRPYLESVIEHFGSEDLLWNPEAAKVVSMRKPRGAETIEALCSKIERGYVPANAAVLEHFLKYPAMVLQSFVDHPDGVFFLGTIYGDQWTNPCVRGLMFRPKASGDLPNRTNIGSVVIKLSEWQESKHPVLLLKQQRREI